MKKRVSLSFDEDLLKAVDQLKKEKFNNLPSRSALVEYYLKKGAEEDIKWLQETRRARVIV